MSAILSIKKVKNLVSKISLEVLGIPFSVIVSRDKVHGSRIYVQVSYRSPCTNTGEIQEWKGRKYYLSDFMTEDEVVKTCYVAFEQCVKHEVMEGFKFNNVILFNPHVNFRELLKISHKEVKRT